VTVGLAVVVLNPPAILLSNVTLEYQVLSVLKRLAIEPEPRTMTIPIVDVYHSGDAKRPVPPFLLVPPGAPRKHLPEPSGGKLWTYWKRVPVNLIAVHPSLALERIKTLGYFLQ